MLLSEFFKKWVWFQGHLTANNHINVFLSLENACNTNGKLSQNLTEKQIMSSKTINLLFNYMCYLFIDFFDWKIGLYRQTVVRGYYTLKVI